RQFEVARSAEISRERMERWMKNLIRRFWNAIYTKYLGGDVISTFGPVKGVPAMGTTGDLQKATGEIRVHLINTKKNKQIVTIEFLQAELSGDSAELACVRLPASEAARLSDMLARAADRCLVR
ncbi:MAG: hypothetical protein VCB25_07555, partial [Myxococcota bacterium]